MARPTKKTPPKPAAKTASSSAKKTAAGKTQAAKTSGAAKPAAAAKTPAKAAAKTPKTPASKTASKTAAAKKPVAAAKPVPAAAAAPAKKAVAAKAPVAAAPAKPAPRKSPLSEKELANVRQELTDQRATLERELEDLDLGSLHVTQSELSGEVSFDEEYADAGTFTFERERDLSLSNNIRDLMDKVDLATRKLDEGTYGTCERCGNPIDKARLKALPYSVLCITCKQKEERIR